MDEMTPVGPHPFEDNGYGFCAACSYARDAPWHPSSAVREAVER